MAKQNNVMTVVLLKKLFDDFKDEISDDFQVWLSSDEEGNEFLPMSQNPEYCLSIDNDTKRIILFPLHR